MSEVSLKAKEIMQIWAHCPVEEHLWVGESDFGLLRAICITGGQFTGEELHGQVVPGGADWNTGFGGSTPETFTSVDMFAKYLLKTDDGVYIAIENTAHRDKTRPSPYIVTTPKFTAPRGKYEWLNYGVYVSHLEAVEHDGMKVIHITVYQML